MEGPQLRLGPTQPMNSSQTPAMYESLRDQCEKHLGHLLIPKGFSGPDVVADSTTGITTIIYSATNLAIECVYEDKERDLSFYVSRVKDGERTTHFAVDETGTRVRFNLFSLLVERGARGFGAPLGRSSNETEIQKRVSDYAGLLLEYGQDILADSPEIFRQK
jgi:hypothetical protein